MSRRFFFQALMACAFLYLAAPPLCADGWTQFRGGPEQRGIADGALPAELEPVWTFKVAEGTESTPAIADGKVYIGSLGGKLYALALADGKQLWTYDAGEEIKSSPLVYDGSVYFGDEAGHFHAVDAATGAGRFKITTEGNITSSANIAPGMGCIVFGSYDAFIYCVSPKDGSLVWKVETQGYVHASPAITAGKVTTSGCDGIFRLVDAATGKVTHELEVGSYVAASTAVRDGVAYFGTFDNKVVAVDLAKSAVAWTFQDAERAFPYYASAAVTAELVIVGGRDKLVHALKRATGEPAWTWSARARVDASPVVAGERVFVADQSGLLAALALADGSVTWQYETGVSFTGSPAVAEGRLVIGNDDGVVYCFAGKMSPSKNPPTGAAR